MVLRKDELEVQLKAEHDLIKQGVLKDDSPLDTSDEFQKLCDACRLGDLKVCQEMIATGVNINARDQFDYTPLILASLCGHYEVVQHLLESGALCERDTFQGERCLYNALNNRIRNLLLQYDYSKSTDPLQPLASHITSLLTRQIPETHDLTVTTTSDTFYLHKFVLSARSPYFQKKLSSAPETTVWKLAPTIPAEAFQIAVRYLYLGEVPSDLGLGPKSRVPEEELFEGIDKVSKQLEIESLWQDILSGSDRRLVRQRRQDEVARGRDQIEAWYRNNVLKHKMDIDTSKADEVKWTRDNAIFADVLLRANEEQDDDFDDDESEVINHDQAAQPSSTLSSNGIPIGPAQSRSTSRSRKSKHCTLFPAHRAMLLRSEYFLTMFSSAFSEAQMGQYLHIITVDCTPQVLQAILDFLYTEKADFPLEIALDVLVTADMLFIEKLKNKAAVLISTLGNGSKTVVKDQSGLPHKSTNKEEDKRDGEAEEEVEIELINVYDVIRAGWLTRVQRLEEFAARYLANRLEDYIDEPEFEELIKESAERIQKRQETDSIELLDDIRYYLSERFRLRFEDSGLEDVMDENEEANKAEQAKIAEGFGDWKEDEAIDVELLEERKTSAVIAATGGKEDRVDPFINGQIRTLDGKVADDEFEFDAINYRILLGKIDALLIRLKLDA